jgi:hypothetical protein
VVICTTPLYGTDEYDRDTSRTTKIRKKKVDFAMEGYSECPWYEGAWAWWAIDGGQSMVSTLEYHYNLPCTLPLGEVD